MKPEKSFFYKRNCGRRLWLFFAFILMLPLGILSSVRGSAAEKAERSAEEDSADRLLPVKSAASITGTDALGRRLKRVSGYQGEKYVGLFYFLWLGQQNQKTVYDITDILRMSALPQLLDTNSDAYPNDLTYFFNEPLYGYYNSADPFVLRKHVELFIAADIDFLVFDVTNGIYTGWPAGTRRKLHSLRIQTAEKPYGISIRRCIEKGSIRSSGSMVLTISR